MPVSPTISGLGDGGFVATWTSTGQDGGGFGVYGQVFSSDSTVLYATDDPDTFWFGLETGDVTIQDFLIGEDEIDLSAFGFSSTYDFTIDSNGDGGSLVTLSEVASINILGVSDTDLANSPESFLLV